MKRLARLGLLVSLCATAQAMVVRPAPNFGIEGVARTTNLRSFRGQAVVLVMARDTRVKQFRVQVDRLKEMFQQFATEKVVFVAAIENGPAEIHSDIPFVTAANPAQVAADYGMTGRFGIAVIGVDGNLDLLTDKAISASRVRDAVFNNYESQEGARKQPF